MFQPAESADELGLFCLKAIRQPLNLVSASVLKVSLLNAFVENISTAFYIKKGQISWFIRQKFVVQKSFGNQKINNVEMIDNTRNQSQLE